MDILTIFACLALGFIVGLVFETIYQAESRKFDHARIVALNGENIRLKKKLHEVKKELKTQPTISKKVIEILDFSDPYQDIKFEE